MEKACAYWKKAWSNLCDVRSFCNFALKIFNPNRSLDRYNATLN